MHISKARVKRLSDRELIDLWLLADQQKDPQAFAQLYCELRSRFGISLTDVTVYFMALLMSLFPFVAMKLWTTDLHAGPFLMASSVMAAWRFFRSSNQEAKRLKESGHQFFRLPRLSNQELRHLILKLPDGSQVRSQLESEFAMRSPNSDEDRDFSKIEVKKVLSLYVMLVVLTLCWAIIVDGTLLESLGFRIAEGTKWKVTLSITAISGIITQTALFFQKRRY